MTGTDLAAWLALGLSTVLYALLLIYALCRVCQGNGRDIGRIVITMSEETNETNETSAVAPAKLIVGKTYRIDSKFTAEDGFEKTPEASETTFSYDGPSVGDVNEDRDALSVTEAGTTNLRVEFPTRDGKRAVGLAAIEAVVDDGTVVDAGEIAFSFVEIAAE